MGTCRSLTDRITEELMSSLERDVAPRVVLYNKTVQTAEVVPADSPTQANLVVATDHGDRRFLITIREVG